MMIAAEQILNWGDSLLYPLLFDPIYKSRIWGGERIGQIFDRQLPSNDIEKVDGPVIRMVPA